MKKKPHDERDWHERRIEEFRQAERERRAVRQPAPTTSAPAAPHAPVSQPTKKTGEVGLANEPRPGLGTRTADSKPAAKPAARPKKKAAKSKSKPHATKRGYEEPPPAPREQAPDSMAHEEERDTGVSGHTSGD